MGRWWGDKRADQEKGPEKGISAALDRVVTEVSLEGQHLSRTVSEDREGTTQISGEEWPRQEKSTCWGPEMLREKQKDA